MLTTYLIFAVSLFVQGPQASDPVPERVVVVHFEGELSEALAALSVRAIRSARKLQAKAIVFEIDTPGGEIALMDRILNEIESVPDLLTVSYVVQKAASAGALISITCDRLYMKPGSNIGSARPIFFPMFPMPVPTELQNQDHRRSELEEKIISHIRSQIRSKAQRSGRNPALAEAMVDQQVAVLEIVDEGVPRIVTQKEYEERLELVGEVNVRKVRTISPRGELLNLTAHEALELLFIDGLAINRSEVLKALDLADAKVYELKVSWSERLASFTQSFSWLLLAVGLICVFIEMKLPGFGIPGILGLLCLGLLFFGKYLAGLAEVTEILLILVGFLLVAVEVFVLPGTFIAGILGGLAILAGIVLSFQSYLLPDDAPPGLEQEWWDNVTTIAGSFAFGLLAMYALAQLLPRMPYFNRVSLRGNASVDPRLVGPPVDDLHRDWRPSIGSRGLALSALRPAGKIDLDGHQIDALAEGQFVEAGARIAVVRVEGSRVLVRQI